jgi:hypothetical protein
VFSLEHYFASELFAAVSETLAIHILTREYQIMQQYTDNKILGYVKYDGQPIWHRTILAVGTLYNAEEILAYF